MNKTIIGLGIICLLLMTGCIPQDHVVEVQKKCFEKCHAANMSYYECGTDVWQSPVISPYSNYIIQGYSCECKCSSEVVVKNKVQI